MARGFYLACELRCGEASRRRRLLRRGVGPPSAPGLAGASHRPWSPAAATLPAPVLGPTPPPGPAHPAQGPGHAAGPPSAVTCSAGHGAAPGPGAPPVGSRRRCPPAWVTARGAGNVGVQAPAGTCVSLPRADTQGWDRWRRSRGTRRETARTRSGSPRAHPLGPTAASECPGGSAAASAGGHLARRILRMLRGVRWGLSPVLICVSPMAHGVDVFHGALSFHIPL